ncbi:transposase mutator type [Corallococcus macrosporus]|uniref:Mutator family transposase n=1 Tax=Myxococcus fulvus (strain ATCC BAA-855 / HW-1) TaxID=483219 RepID=F8CFB2_MYXFH|nr:transposase mutator type [Corallococcus macrosporus]
MDDTEFESPAHEAVQADLRALFRGAIRMTLEALLEEEVGELVGAGRWQRMVGRADVRNGSYLRTLVTTAGAVDVAVPRTRHSGSAGDVLGRYKRRSGELDEAITSAYVQNVSTRRMGKVTRALMGEAVSRSGGEPGDEDAGGEGGGAAYPAPHPGLSLPLPGCHLP